VYSRDIYKQAILDIKPTVTNLASCAYKSSGNAITVRPGRLVGEKRDDY
jgi:hypothetical protein